MGGVEVLPTWCEIQVMNTSDQTLSRAALFTALLYTLPSQCLKVAFHETKILGQACKISLYRLNTVFNLSPPLVASWWWSLLPSHYPSDHCLLCCPCLLLAHSGILIHCAGAPSGLHLGQPTGRWFCSGFLL